MTEKKNILKFIQTEDSNDGGLLLQRAFDKAKSNDHELTVEFISASELLKEDLGNDNSLFIISVFTGECFEFLVAKKKRVFGPLAILRCLEEKIPLPNVLYPVYSLAMKGVIISCTSIAKPRREKLYEIVKFMGGITSKDFTSSVTHLVAEEVGSKKYTIACNLEKLVVLPSWVEDSWKATQKHDFDATDVDFVTSHLCPIFKGCSFCVTGIEGKKRKEIKTAVENHGGVYSAELKLKSTTHLLVERPVGEKYEFALRWNVNCVHPNWMYDCIKAGHWLDETSYSVKGERDLDRTRSTGGQLSNVTTVNATINSTAASVGTSTKAAEAARRSAETYGRKDLFHESRSDGGTRRTIMKPDNDDSFDYNVTIPSGGMFLDGCTIYLSGFTGARLEFLQKIINAGGATRFNQISANVTHVVMGETVAKDLKILTESEFIPHVVNAQWLLDCCHQEKCLPETDYYSMESGREVFVDSAKPAAGGSKKGQMTLEKGNLVENDDVLSEYLEFMQDDMTADLEEPNVRLATDLNMSKKTNEAKTNNTVSCDDCNSIDDEESQHFLNGLRICTQGFSENQKSQVKELIERCGGTFLEETSTEIADFLMLPMNYKCNYRTSTMVTFCWLESSAECGKLLEPTSNFLFTPFSLAKDIFPLKDSVISISQYVGVKRDHLMQLAEMLGAHYQEFLSRKDRANLLANTHLLLQEPIGPKYEAALHWNIPAITSDWLFECARTGTKVSEGPYKLYKEQSDERREMGREEGEMGKEEGEMGKEEVGGEEACPVNNKASTSLHLPAPEESTSNNNKLDCIEIKDAMNMTSDNEKDKDQGTESLKFIPSDTNLIINKPPACFGRPKRPSFDLSDAIEALQSPACSSGSSGAHSRLSRSRSSFPLDDYIQENMQVALKNSGNLLVSHGVDNSSNNLPEKKKKELDTNKFLHGVILAVSKKLNKQQGDIHKMASAVGADYRWSLDDLCTHIIHEGRMTREYNQAKSKGVYVVSPHWLYSCVDNRCHADETLFPPTYNPKLSLSVVKARRPHGPKYAKQEVKHKETGVETNETTSKMPKESPVKLAGSSTTDTSDHDVTKNPAADDDDDVNILKADEAKTSSQDSAQRDCFFEKHFNEIVHALSSRRRSKRHNSDQHSRNSSGNSVGESSRNLSRRSSRLRSLRSGQNSSADEHDEQPLETITYDDPKSRIERERIIAQLSNCSPDHASTKSVGHSGENDETINGKKRRESKSDCSTTEDEIRPVLSVKTEASSPTRTPTPTAPPPPIALQITTTQHDKPEPISLLNPMVEIERVKPRNAPKFMLSSMSQQEKIDYGALIEELGGEVFDNQYFNPECCHIIVGQLNRNEKCLASIAAGNWVLHKSYLEASRKTGHFVDEEDHEWGVEIPGKTLSNLDIAAKRWRMKLGKTSRQEKSDTKIGAFHSWKVLLYVENNKLASFARLLEAGGAKVLGTTPRLNEINSVTHAFISSGKPVPIESVDFDHLNQAKVLVLRTDYIADYLIEDPPPSPHKYLFRKERQKSRKRKPDEDSSGNIEEKRSRKN